MGPAQSARRVDLAAIVRTHAGAVRQTQRLTRGQHRALRAMATCRTAALGGHLEACDHCGALRNAYTSCRNRHCPTCQTLAKARWLAARRAFDQGALRFAGSAPGLADPAGFTAFLATLRAQDWVVYAKPPFGGPGQGLEYLGRSTHRVAMSNDSLVSLEEGSVRFRWRDYAHGDRLKTMALPGAEFLQRFLLHVLPAGYVRIRHFGRLANRGRTAKLARCRALLAAAAPAVAPGPESGVARMLRLTRVDSTRCPVCLQGRLQRVGVLPRGSAPFRCATPHETPCGRPPSSGPLCLCPQAPSLQASAGIQSP